MCLAANLDLVDVLAKLATVLDKPRSSRSLEEEFGVDPGVATTEAEYTEVLNGGGSGGRGVQRLGGHALVQRTPRPLSPWSYHCGARDESAGRSDLGNRGAGSGTQRNISFTTAAISKLCEGSS